MKTIYINELGQERTTLPTSAIIDGRLVTGPAAAAGWSVKPPAPEPEPLTLLELKALKRQEIADARFEAEVAGFTLQGMPVRTDRETQARLAQACMFAFANPTFETDWKLSNGTFVHLTAEQIIGVSQAVLTYVQGCFTKEAQLNLQIEAAEDAEQLNMISWS
jgi:hypothetical protein